MKILIVEDNELTRNSLAEILTLDCHTVRMAVDGSSALDMLEDFAPDVVILDNYLPHLDGVEVLRRMRSHQPFSTIPVVLTTAADDEGVDRARQSIAGLARVVLLRKPFDLVQLSAALAEVVQTPFA